MVHQFFYPKSIAIVGATSDPKKFGNAVTANLLENDKLEAEIYPINPKATEIFGPSESLFVVFSDDIEWCRQHLKYPPPN